MSKRLEKKKRGWITSENADINDLYERSVQCPESEVDLVYQAWFELRNRRPYTIREDFCGTSAVAREWVKRDNENRVWGIDLDPEVLQWARLRMDGELTPEQRSRVKLTKQDVMQVEGDKVDSVLAMNFSYFGFKERSDLIKYFTSVHQSLVKDGLFLLDAYGGSDSFLEIEEDRDLDGFTYIWDQHSVNPITGCVLNHIHFEFPDGSKIERAFTYDWRFWTLPEIKDVLLEAGFSTVSVYWEGTDGDGDGNGVWKIDERGEACAGWVAYIAASY